MEIGRLKIELKRREAVASRPVSERFAPRYGRTGPVGVGSSETALNIATVYRCANVISSSVASLPFKYLKRSSNGVFAPEKESGLNYLLGVQPNEDFNAYDFMSMCVRDILFSGNAYIVPVFANDNPTVVLALKRATPSCVTYDTLNRTYAINDPENDLNGAYAEREVIHLKGMSLDGKNGLSVLSFARQTMSVSATGDAETLSRFANGGNVRGLVSNDNSVKGFGEYADQELDNQAEVLDGKFSSGAKIVAVHGQAQFKQLSLSSVDLEFLSTRKFSVLEICRFFSVPPSFVYADTSNNYKSAELASVDFLSQTLNPILISIEQEFERKLIPAFRFGKYKFQFDRRAVAAMDLESRADYQMKTIQSGVYTINDWRKYENLPVVPDGDRVLVSANIKALDELVNNTANE